jgi:transposase-like protein
MTSIALPLPGGGAPKPAKDAAGGKSTNFPLRQRTGTSHRRLLSRAVDMDVDELHDLSPMETVFAIAQARWGSRVFMPCPHCMTMDEHYWSSKELRWKCTGCGKRFSVTSNTPLADHKLPLNKILRIIFQWSLPASGRPATDLRKEHGHSYRAMFNLAHKLREGLVRGFNIGVLCGVQEMDGADLNGRRYKEKRNKPQSGFANNGAKAKIPESLLKPRVDAETGEIMGPPKPPKFDKASKQPEDRRLMLVIRQRGLAKRRGAVATRICIALTESSKTVMAAAKRFVSAESKFMSDEDPSYAAFGREFASHGTVNHSKTYSAPGGVNNNQAESFNKRMKRSNKGIYLAQSNKYLADYACEAAWREDLRESSTRDRLASLLKTVLGVGLSRWWRGYWQGVYREFELLIEGAQPAPPRGKKKGAKAKVPR